MNLRFVVRGAVFALALLALALIVVSLLPSPLAVPLRALWSAPPPDPTPQPPVICAALGGLPAGTVGLQEWVQYRGESFDLIGSGFLLRLAEGSTVGVVTAHSLLIGDPLRPLERVAFAASGQTGFVAEFDTLRGPPGQPRTGADMTVDYVLLQATGPVRDELALAPDPRGAPQPGERVALFSGPGDGAGGRRRVLEGTVQSVEPTAVWAMMDEYFDPSRMSGSPLLSRHTGQVVGMAIAASPHGDRLMIGFHPIGSLVRLAHDATEPLLLVEYQR